MSGLVRTSRTYLGISVEASRCMRHPCCSRRGALLHRCWCSCRNCNSNL